MNSLITPPPAQGEIVALLFIYKDGFGIEYPMKFDMPLNKEIKPNQTKLPWKFMKRLPGVSVRKQWIIIPLKEWLYQLGATLDVACHFQKPILNLLPLFFE